MGLGLVGLDEGIVQTGSIEDILLVGFHEVATIIAEDLRLDDDNTFDVGFNEIERHIK